MDKEGGASKRVSVAFELEDEELFATPANLKERHAVAMAGSTAEAEDANRWLAGIVEVSLAPEDKMAAIEATDQAKRKLMQDKVSRLAAGPAISMEIPANFNANFHKHRREGQHLMKSSSGGGKAGGWMVAGALESGHVEEHPAREGTEGRERGPDGFWVARGGAHARGQREGERGA